MKVIIAGSRDIEDAALVEKAIKASGFVITEVVSGGARGVDSLGEAWATTKSIPIKVFPANWSLGLSAGPLRNSQMVDYGEALIAIWRNGSRGTADTIAKAKAKGIPVYVEVV